MKYYPLLIFSLAAHFSACALPQGVPPKQPFESPFLGDPEPLVRTAHPGGISFVRNVKVASPTNVNPSTAAQPLTRSDSSSPVATSNQTTPPATTAPTTPPTTTAPTTTTDEPALPKVEDAEEPLPAIPEAETNDNDLTTNDAAIAAKILGETPSTDVPVEEKLPSVEKYSQDAQNASKPTSSVAADDDLPSVSDFHETSQTTSPIPGVTTTEVILEQPETVDDASQATTEAKAADGQIRTLHQISTDAKPQCPHGFCYDPRNAARYIRDTFDVNHVKLKGDTPQQLYDHCKKKSQIVYTKTPKIGDIVFFHNTADLNGDNSANDWFTHVAVVTKINRKNTIIFVGWQPGGLQSHALNLEHPTQNTKWTLNDQLRGVYKGERLSPNHYADKLFAGFCRVLGEQAYFNFIEKWEPATK